MRDKAGTLGWNRNGLFIGLIYMANDAEFFTITISFYQSLCEV